MSASETVELELGEVCTLTLNRPEKGNAMSKLMADEIKLAAQAVAEHEGARLLLLRGAGKAFCAGGDFAMLERNAAQQPETNRVAMEKFYRSFLALLELPVPTMAVVHGAAVGAGLCVAMACDLRVAAAEAKLGANFVRVGLHPGMGCSVLLPHLVGPAKAAELLLTGRLIRGAEAARLGLVNEAVPRAELEARVQELQNELLGAAPIAQAQLTQTLRRPLRDKLGPALEREASCQAIDFATADLAEAVRAFGDGRSPVFKGS